MTILLLLLKPTRSDESRRKKKKKEREIKQEKLSLSVRACDAREKFVGHAKLSAVRNVIAASNLILASI